MTTSKSLLDAITKNTATLEKHVMINVFAAREAYCSIAISDIGSIRSEFNAADTMTVCHGVHGIEFGDKMQRYPFLYVHS